MSRNLKVIDMSIIKKDIVEEIITAIEEEIKQSSSTKYICEDGTVIRTDVGYVYDWFEEYKGVLRRKYKEK